MPLETMGLGAQLIFDDAQGVAAIRRSDQAFNVLNVTSDKTTINMGQVGNATAMATAKMGILGSSVDKVSVGLGKINGAMQAASLAVAGIGIGLGIGAKKAMDFEQQMSAVRSVTAPTVTSQEELDAAMSALTKKAKQLGATTVFTATQAGQAIENMGKAGFTTSETLDAIAGTMYAAAAEGMDLATASDIVTSNVRSFGFEASKASLIADQLAMASANSNTNMVDLQEGMKYVAPVSKKLGISFEDTAAALGILSDSGIKGSMAGTAMRNALEGLVDPSSKGRAIMDKLHISMKNNADGSFDLSNLLRQLQTGFNNLGSPIDRVAAASRLFGVRGEMATNILSRLDKTAGSGALTFDEFTAKLKGAQGTAKQMSDIRLDNLAGQFEMLGGAVDAMSIALFTGPSRGMTDLVKTAATSIGGVADAMDSLREGMGREDAEKQWGRTIVAVAYGMIDGVEAVSSAVDSLMATIRSAGEWIGASFGGEAISSIARLAVEFGAVAMAMTPVLAALVTVGFLLGSVIIPSVSGLGAVLSGVLGLLSGPVLAGIAVGLGAIGLALSVARNDGESMGDTIVRSLTWIKDTAIDLFDNVLMPFWSGFASLYQPVIQELGVIWAETAAAIRFSIDQISAQFAEATGGAGISWAELGRTIATVLGTIMVTVAQVVSFIIQTIAMVAPAFVWFHRTFGTFLLTPFQMLYNLAGRVFGAVAMLYGGDVLSGLARLGVAILDAVLTPLRYVVTQVSKLAEILGAEVPAALKTFGQEGLSGMLWPERETPKVATIREMPAIAPAGAKVTQLGAEVQAARTIDLTNEGIGDAVAKALQANPPRVQNQNTINVNSRVDLDGKEISRSVTKHQEEIWERSGAKATPWQRNVMREHGALPAPGR